MIESQINSFVVRHAEYQNNGVLTGEGEKLSVKKGKEIRRLISETNGKKDLVLVAPSQIRILSYPASRAVQTAERIQEGLGIDTPIELLKDFDFGRDYRETENVEKVLDVKSSLSPGDSLIVTTHLETAGAIAKALGHKGIYRQFPYLGMYSSLPYLGELEKVNKNSPWIPLPIRSNGEALKAFKEFTGKKAISDNDIIKLKTDDGRLVVFQIPFIMNYGELQEAKERHRHHTFVQNYNMNVIVATDSLEVPIHDIWLEEGKITKEEHEAYVSQIEGLHALLEHLDLGNPNGDWQEKMNAL